ATARPRVGEDPVGPHRRSPTVPRTGCAGTRASRDPTSARAARTDPLPTPCCARRAGHRTAAGRGTHRTTATGPCAGTTLDPRREATTVSLAGTTHEACNP